MAKTKGIEAWGRDAARKRYASGGDVEVNVEPEGGSPILEPQPADRASEVDEFISRVMQDQIKKMKDD